jgi:signal transduction histidine kinase
MISMCERIRLVGGTLTVSSKHLLGTQIEVEIRLSRAKLAETRAS